MAKNTNTAATFDRSFNADEFKTRGRNGKSDKVQERESKVTALRAENGSAFKLHVALDFGPDVKVSTVRQMLRGMAKAAGEKVSIRESKSDPNVLGVTFTKSTTK